MAKLSLLYLIQVMRDTDHNGNAECYDRTLHMLELFDKKFEQKFFSEIDIKYVRAFDVFLQTPRETVYTSKKGNTRVVQRNGNSGNSRRIIFKTLRAILNAAIEAKEASQSTYPFGKGGFQVAKLGEETEGWLVNPDSDNWLYWFNGKPQADKKHLLWKGTPTMLSNIIQHICNKCAASTIKVAFDTLDYVKPTRSDYKKGSTYKKIEQMITLHNKKNIKISDPTPTHINS